MSVSRRHWFGTCLGLGAAVAAVGCNAPASDPAPAAMPAATDIRASAPAAGDPDAQRSRAVAESVHDNVDRVTEIIRQREQATREAADLRELKDATANAPTDAAIADADTAEANDDASTVERLADALRNRQPIDEPVQASPATRPSEPIAGAISDPPRVEFERGVVAVAAEPPADENPSPEVARGSRMDPMDVVVQRHVARVAEDPRDLAAQLGLQIARFLNGESVPSMTDMAATPAEDRELLSAVVNALTNFRDLVAADPNPLASQKARPFVEMGERIQARADLTLAGLTLCRKVGGYGNYEPLDLRTFSPAASRVCVLYCEVDGFLSQLGTAGSWDTKLSLELKLYDAHGMRVWGLPAKTYVDTSRRRRRDFFIAVPVTLPANLGGGEHLLKATVKDVQANRVAESTIRLTVLPRGESAESLKASTPGKIEAR